MCRSIKPLFNVDPPATDEEIRAAALQFVRKISGYHQPSQANEVAFGQAIDDITRATRQLLDALHTAAEPRDREALAARARERAAKREH
jgi:hypothetical protein